MNHVLLLRYRLLWLRNAGAGAIPWDYPVRNGTELSLTQVYLAVQSGTRLEVQ